MQRKKKRLGSSYESYPKPGLPTTVRSCTRMEEGLRDEKGTERRTGGVICSRAGAWRGG